MFQLLAELLIITTMASSAGGTAPSQKNKNPQITQRASRHYEAAKENLSKQAQYAFQHVTQMERAISKIEHSGDPQINEKVDQVIENNIGIFCQLGQYSLLRDCFADYKLMKALELQKLSRSIIRASDMDYQLSKENPGQGSTALKRTFQEPNRLPTFMNQEELFAEMKKFQKKDLKS